MGEDLPLNVYKQWRHWCQFQHYFFDDPAIKEVMRARYAQVKTPIIAANALDDLWASPVSRDAFMQGYRNANWEGIDISKAVWCHWAHGIFQSNCTAIVG